MSNEGDRPGPIVPLLTVILKKMPFYSRQDKKPNGKKMVIFTRWSLIISIWTFFIAVGISSISDILLRQSSLLLGFLTLIMIVLIGALTDMIGVAITAVDLPPFNAMAAKKVYGARKCIHIIRNADKYANFFNDVVGDVAGYIAGFAGASIVIEIVRLSDEMTMYESVVSVLVAGLTSSAIVGSKAVGKNLALTYRTEIVLFLGKFLTVVDTIFAYFKKIGSISKKQS
ncbi:MAG: hypothetical protein H0Z33_05240 [Bacillaceae bacterium]|nr:hypothetical protein [Bacillaceae bacterium]